MSYDAATNQRPQRPETIGRYRILGEIGVGGMGTVYKAEQDKLGTRQRLKLLAKIADAVQHAHAAAYEHQPQSVGRRDHGVVSKNWLALRQQELHRPHECRAALRRRVD